jgi:hypothetical protein
MALVSVLMNNFPGAILLFRHPCQAILHRAQYCSCFRQGFVGQGCVGGGDFTDMTSMTSKSTPTDSDPSDSNHR